jgi:U6 snRNA-associated Sm-like protein LSm1
VLRSFDQFSNFVLEDTSERRFCVPSKSQQTDDSEAMYYYTDIHLGLYLIRGDSIVILGEASDMPSPTIHNPNGRPAGKEVDLDELEDLLEQHSPNNGSEINWDFDTDLL